MINIYKRELYGFFYTSAGYIYLFIYMSLASLFYGLGNLADYSGNMLLFMRNLSYLWMLTTPLLTMRSFAGEKSHATDILLFSSSISTNKIVIAKYMALLSILMTATLLSSFFCILTAVYGKLYIQETLVAYLGFFLQGACFLSLDLYVSAHAKTQISAAIFAFGINLSIWLLDALSAAFQGSIIQKTIDFISLNQRFTPFAQGQLSFANIIYALFLIICFLYASSLVIEKSKQR